MTGRGTVRVFRTGFFGKETAGLMRGMLRVCAFFKDRPGRGLNEVENHIVRFCVLSIEPDGEIVLKIPDFDPIRYELEGRSAALEAAKNEIFAMRGRDPLKVVAQRAAAFLDEFAEEARPDRVRRLTADGFFGFSAERELEKLECLIDVLKEEDDPAKKYGEKTVKELIGERRDPIRTELEIARRKEIEKTKRELEKEVLSVGPASRVLLELKHFFDEKLKRRIEALNAEFDGIVQEAVPDDGAEGKRK